VKIIFNSSPLIFLARLHLLEIFLNASDEFYLPEFVIAPPPYPKPDRSLLFQTTEKGDSEALLRSADRTPHRKCDRTLLFQTKGIAPHAGHAIALDYSRQQQGDRTPHRKCYRSFNPTGDRSLLCQITQRQSHLTQEMRSHSTISGNKKAIAHHNSRQQKGDRTSHRKCGHLLILERSHRYCLKLLC
jgi:hypothetical protein